MPWKMRRTAASRREKLMGSFRALVVVLFFFQAEDGIRDLTVTGVQTCALPISALLEYLNGLGFPFKGSTEDYGKLFWEAFMWLKGGNPNARGMITERVAKAKTEIGRASCRERV